MKILIVGATGTLGKRIVSRLSANHEIISAGRSSGDVRVDLRSKDAIERMYSTTRAGDEKGEWGQRPHSRGGTPAPRPNVCA